MNNKEMAFAYKIRNALDESLERIPSPTLRELEKMRQHAVAMRKQSSDLALFSFAPALAGYVRHLAHDQFAWFSRVSVAIPLIVVAAGLIGMYQIEQQERISDIAEIDALVLADELPLSAYVDNGFNVFLTQRGE
jgi:Protein of unknown function (DUF3619)